MTGNYLSTVLTSFDKNYGHVYIGHVYIGHVYIGHHVV